MSHGPVDLAFCSGLPYPSPVPQLPAALSSPIACLVPYIDTAVLPYGGVERKRHVFMCIQLSVLWRRRPASSTTTRSCSKAPNSCRHAGETSSILFSLPLFIPCVLSSPTSPLPAHVTPSPHAAGVGRDGGCACRRRGRSRGRAEGRGGGTAAWRTGGLRLSGGRVRRGRAPVQHHLHQAGAEA